MQQLETATLDGERDDPTLGWALVVAHHYGPEYVGTRVDVSTDSGIDLGRGGEAFGPGVLDDEHLSRSHAHFEVDERGALQVADRDSRNGVFVNGARVEIARLRRGDVVGVGRMLLVAERSPPGFAAPRSTSLVGATIEHVRCVDTVQRAATRSVPLLLWGPTGCGKNRLARHYHSCSGRPGEFVEVACGSLTEATASAVLMGVDGPGLLDRAHRGTLHLDGVDDAPDSVQAALLEFLEHGRVRRTATGETADLDVRVVASARGEPKSLSSLRREFLHRVARWTIAVPRLAGRPSDVARMVVAFARRFAGDEARLDPELVFRLLRHSWPGNARELEAVMERCAVEESGDGVLREFPDLDEILTEPHDAGVISTMSRVPRPERSLVVSSSGKWFVGTDGEKHNLERRKILARLFGALMDARRERPGDPMTTDDLLAAGWPNARFVEGTGANRVYVALTTLRKLGLRDVVVRTGRGYLVDPAVPLRVVEE